MHVSLWEGTDERSEHALCVYMLLTKEDAFG